MSFNARAVQCHARENCFLGQTKILKWCHLNGNLEEALLFLSDTGEWRWVEIIPYVHHIAI